MYLIAASDEPKHKIQISFYLQIIVCIDEYLVDVITAKKRMHSSFIF